MFFLLSREKEIKCRLISVFFCSWNCHQLFYTFTVKSFMLPMRQMKLQPKNILFVRVFGFLSGIVCFSVAGSGNILPFSWSETFSGRTQVVLWGEVETEKAEIDHFSDISLQKFLDSDHLLAPEYRAPDLQSIDSVFTSNDAAHFKLRIPAATQFADMARAFSNTFDFKVKLSIMSARRSAKYQKELADNCSSTRCADAGASEHEAGLALDLGVNGGNIMRNNGKYYNRLKENAHKRGFHNTYQKGIAIDGKIPEPRHRRYVGVEFATQLYQSGLSFAEYFYSLYPKTHD